MRADHTEPTGMQSHKKRHARNKTHVTVGDLPQGCLWAFPGLHLGGEDLCAQTEYAREMRAGRSTKSSNFEMRNISRLFATQPPSFV